MGTIKSQQHPMSSPVESMSPKNILVLYCHAKQQQQNVVHFFELMKKDIQTSCCD
jgi:hypothetical protein